MHIIVRCIHKNLKPHINNFIECKAYNIEYIFKYILNKMITFPMDGMQNPQPLPKKLIRGRISDYNSKVKSSIFFENIFVPAPLYSVLTII